MKKMRPAAKGIRSIRGCIGALLWDRCSRYYELSAKLNGIAKKCARLPGGEDAAWFLMHADFFGDIAARNTATRYTATPESFVSLIDAKFKDATDKRLALYYTMAIIGAPVWDSLMYPLAVTLGCERSRYKTEHCHVSVSNQKLERDAIAGCLSAVDMLSNRDYGTLVAACHAVFFWKFVACIVHKRSFMSASYPPGDSLPVQQYEYGILFGDARHCEVEMMESTRAAGQRFEQFALSVNEAAKRAIDTWLVIATRLRVVKDIRRVIGLLLWSERVAWAGTVPAAAAVK